MTNNGAILDREFGRGRDRYWCTLYPCIEDPAVRRPEAYGGRSFATREAYDRHLREGHFLVPGAPGTEPHLAPSPYRHTWEGSDDRD